MSTQQIGAGPGESGTAVRFLEPRASAQPSPFGSSLLVGPFQWGPVDEPKIHDGIGSYRALRGTPMREDPTPLCAEHWFQLAKGAGRLITLRIADGNEAKAVRDIYARDVAVSRSLLGTHAKPSRVLRAEGLYAGRRGGQLDIRVGYAADLSAIFSASSATFATGFTLKTDQFKGARLQIEGVARSYRVLGNTAAGVLAIEVPSGDAGPASAAGTFYVVLDRTDERNVTDGLGFRVDSSSQAPSSKFGFGIWDERSGRFVSAWPALSLDSADDGYAERVVNAAGAAGNQHWLGLTAYDIGDPAADEMRPANWVGLLDHDGGRPAVSMLTVVAGSSTADGDYFTVGDGETVVVFEFDDDASVTAGRTAITFGGSETQAAMAALVLAAINASALNVTAYLGGPDGVVVLRHDRPTDLDLTLTENVSNAGFLASGWSTAVNLASAPQLQTSFFERAAGATGTPYLDPTSVSYGASPIRCRAKVTFTAATTADVVFEDWEGERTLSSGFTVAGSAGLTLGTAFDPDCDYLPAFKLIAGGVAAVAGDIVYVYFNPLPADLTTRQPVFVPHATDVLDGDLRTGFPVLTRASASAITLLSSVDLADDHGVRPPVPAIGVAGAAGPYDLSGGPGLTLIYQIGAEAAVTLTTTLSGAATTAAALAADLNTLAAAAATVQRVFFGATDDGLLYFYTAHDVGSDATLKLTTGTINAQISVANNTIFQGADGNVCALGFADLLEAGADGVADLADADYAVPFHTGGLSPLDVLASQNLGLVKMAAPGASSATVQNQGVAYAALRGWMFRGEIDPSDATTEAAAAAWVKDNIVGDRNFCVAWDSYGYVRSRPFSGEDLPYPMTGAILGMEARLAADRGGYHITAAGLKANIGTIFRRVASVADGVTPPRKNEATLNQVGIQAVQTSGAAIYVNGGRCPEDGYLGTIWKHQYECALHLGHQLAVAGLPFVWEGNDDATRQQAIAAIKPILLDLWETGWFARQPGEDFDDVVLIAAGPDENPPAQVAAGVMAIVVELVRGFVGTAERVRFDLGTGGVSAIFSNT